jgi:hypothetical protein
VTEFSERLFKMKELEINLRIKMDKVIYGILRLDVLNNEFRKSVNDIIKVIKAINVMKKILAKSLHKEAFSTDFD